MPTRVISDLFLESGFPVTHLLDTSLLLSLFGFHSFLVLSFCNISEYLI